MNCKDLLFRAFRQTSYLDDPKSVDREILVGDL
nr:MAG TPA: hypothetical protein [Caudoviricetes sp.]